MDDAAIDIDENGEEEVQPPHDWPTTLEEGWLKGYYITNSLDELERGLYKDVGKEAIWTLSSARAGEAVDELMSDDLDKYWNSDGAAPHTLTLQFYQRQRIAEVCVRLDYSKDESYTPDRVILRAGPTVQDVEDVRDVRLTEPTGWVRIPLGVKDGIGMSRYQCTWVLSLSIPSMHQNGKDLHVRAVKVLAPALAFTAAKREASAGPLSTAGELAPSFQSLDLLHGTIR